MPTKPSGSRKIGRKKSRSAAQERYRNSTRLVDRKIKNLMDHTTADGKPRFASEKQAMDFWLSVRKRRPMTVYERAQERMA